MPDYQNHSFSLSKPEKIIIFTFLCCIFLLCIFQVSDPDIFWHLKTGQYIWEHKEIPKQDIFSYTAAGKTWITHEWLSQLILFGIYSLGGICFLNIIKALVTTFVFALMIHLLRLRVKDLFLVLLVLALAFGLARYRFTVRPQFLVDPLLVSFLLIWERFRAGKLGWLWLLIPLQILWSNLHASAILGIVLSGISLIEIYLSRILNKKKKSKENISDLEPDKFGKNFKIGLFIALLLIPASFINPHHFHTLLYPLSQMRLPWLSPESQPFMRFITENAHLSWGFFKNSFPLALPWVVIILIAFAERLWRRDPEDLLKIIGFSTLFVSAIRYGGILAVVTALPVASTFSRFFKIIQTRKYDSRKLTKWMRNICYVSTFIFLLAIFIVDQRIFSWGWGFDPLAYPKGAVEFVQKNQLKGNMFNEFEMGGYLIWKLYPDYKVFFDGRPDVYGSDFFNQYHKIHSQLWRWNALCAEHQIEWSVISYTQAVLIDQMFDKELWSLCYWDDVTLVFLRRSGTNSAVIAKNGFRYLKPYWPLNICFEFFMKYPNMLPNWLSEIEKANYLGLSSSKTLRLQALLWQLSGRLGEAEAIWVKILADQPKDDLVHFFLANLLDQTGRYKKATGHYLKFMKYSEGQDYPQFKAMAEKRLAK